MFRGLAIGDLHYDRLTKLFGEHLGNKLITHELRKAFSYAKSNGIEEVFLLGDVSHKARMSYSAHNFFLDALIDYQDAFNIHIPIGNHDWQEDGVHALEIIQKLFSKLGHNVHVYSEPKQLVINGISVNFLPHPYTEPLPCRMPTLNFGHFEVPGAIRDNGTKSKDDNFLDDNNHYILGHLHTPHSHRNKHYVGTLYQTNFGESLPKSFTDFTCMYKGDKLRIKYNRIDNTPKVKLLTVDVANKQDLQQITDDKFTLYRLVVDADYDLPESWLLEHTNVVSHNYYRSKEEKLALLHESLIIDDESEEVMNMTDIVGNYLETEYKFNTKQVKKALEILERTLTKVES